MIESPGWNANHCACFVSPASFLFFRSKDAVSKKDMKKSCIQCSSILQSLKILLLFFVLSLFVAFRAVFFDIHAFRMFFLVPGADVVFFAANRAFESDTVSHSLTSSLIPADYTMSHLLQSR